MRISHLFSYALLFLICLSCRNTEKQKIIILQPFEDLPKGYLEYVEAELQKLYPLVEIKAPMRLPKWALNNTKTRYRADSLIRILSRNTESDHVTIGLTTKDISTTKDKIADWGVMGLGYCPGNSCIASSFRLDNKNKKVQLFKVAIHELGHTQGIPHCPIETCFMRDAKGKNHKDEETDFCQKCKNTLREKGWKFAD